jgi:hypothetical protein
VHDALFNAGIVSFYEKRDTAEFSSKYTIGNIDLLDNVWFTIRLKPHCSEAIFLVGMSYNEAVVQAPRGGMF